MLAVVARIAYSSCAASEQSLMKMQCALLIRFCRRCFAQAKTALTRLRHQSECPLTQGNAQWPVVHLPEVGLLAASRVETRAAKGLRARLREGALATPQDERGCAMIEFLSREEVR
jgi:hypothetical protein